ncbi:SMP-30/gluconolactonase/LRE family protein [Streptacidiphilus sp. ASG 303]|uniref:SMP-30/gluconolactonase/LRE family protein n=1 Tax=Streptacidiphilus sp. ASG 303 TaxID=2896847 RepID=UPI0027E179E4|nr:SMP-30/gluconolactonase/LRE family protein [Streptacidiphilus sp. ASG 303]
MPRTALQPVVWKPPAPTGRARERKGPPTMPPPELLPISGEGPEDVVVDAEGRLLCGVADGRILRLGPDGSVAETVADIAPGRPAGLQPLPDGRLLVCDARLGRLLRVDPAAGAAVGTADRKGAVEVLADSMDGEPLRFCSNAVTAADGTVYFTESSRRWTIDDWKADILEHSGTGRLLRVGPDGGEPEVLLEGLQFANGVVLGPDEVWVAVAETGAYRVSRLWLAGGRAGDRDVLVELPGFPDNMSTGPSGVVWIAMPSHRDPVLDLLHRTHPAVRRAVWALPPRLQPAPERTVWVIGVDADGRVVHDLQGPGDRFSQVTGVCEHDGRLYLGSLVERAVAVVPLPEAGRASG